MEKKVLGIHHITAIAANAQRNYNFYTKVFGLRLVKKTVNFDDPGTYHFYFGDEVGTPGSILTFFPWEGIGKGHTGTGMATEISYSVPDGSLEFWTDRFKRNNIKHDPVSRRLGEEYLSFQDPDGLNINLVVPGKADSRKGWETGEITTPVAAKGFHSITLTLKTIKATADIFTEVFHYRFLEQEGNRFRYITDAVENAAIVDLVEAPGERAGYNAAGTNHHVAFRVKDDNILMEYRDKIESRGLSITPKINRDYFYSLYFREPGGVLFELATDNPGFTVDEPVDQLGLNLKLPKRYESARERIEQVLPKLS